MTFKLLKVENVPGAVVLGFATDFGLKMIATGAEVVEVSRIGSDGLCFGLLRLRILGEATKGEKCLDGAADMTE